MATNEQRMSLSMIEKTFDHLDRLQHTIGVSSNAKDVGRLGAYLRWRLHSNLDEWSGGEKIQAATKTFPGYCDKCWSFFDNFKVVPKRMKKQTKLNIKAKKPKAFPINKLKGRCSYCHTQFEFNGWSKERKKKKTPKTSVKTDKKLEQKSQKPEITPNLQNQTSKTMKTPHKLKSFKTPVAPSSASKKEQLRRLLSKGSGNQKSGLSHFLSSCFE